MNNDTEKTQDTNKTQNTQETQKTNPLVSTNPTNSLALNTPEEQAKRAAAKAEADKRAADYMKQKEAEELARADAKLALSQKGLAFEVDVPWLTDILSIESAYQDDLDLVTYILKWVNTYRKTNPKAGVDLWWDEYRNLYVVKGAPKAKGFYPCFVAHTDTVHKITGRLRIVRVGDNLTGMDSYTVKPSGCGGDDKVGVYIALEMLKRLDAVKLTFFRNEESGCLGSAEADMTFYKDCAFVLQADRMGNTDFIKHTNGVSVASQAFIKALRPTLSLYGYDTEYGTATDVGQLKINGLDICAANVSCGYYRPHEDNTFVNLPDVTMTLNLFYEIATHFAQRRWEHILSEAERDRKYYGRWSSWENWGSDGYGYTSTTPQGTTGKAQGDTPKGVTANKNASGSANNIVTIKDVTEATNGRVVSASELVKRDQETAKDYIITKRGNGRKNRGTLHLNEDDSAKRPSESDYEWSCRRCGSEDDIVWIGDGWYCENCGEHTPYENDYPRRIHAMTDDETDMNDRGSYLM